MLTKKRKEEVKPVGPEQRSDNLGSFEPLFDIKIT
jgi:hypothetical protein